MTDDDKLDLARRCVPALFLAGVAVWVFLYDMLLSFRGNSEPDWLDDVRRWEDAEWERRVGDSR